MADGIGEKKARVRPPRVHITYDVETNGAEEVKEIPFAVGVVAGLSGRPKEPLPKLKERKFVTIDRDNIDEVMAGMTPRVAIRVPDRLTGEGGELTFDLEFTKMSDFSPESIARRTEPLATLLEARCRLKDLLSRGEGNERLEELLAEILKDETLKKKVEAVVAKEASTASTPIKES